ncbi:MAG: nuclease-related domain-containing protein [Lachnospiraceae bacterium]
MSKYVIIALVILIGAVMTFFLIQYVRFSASSYGESASAGFFEVLFHKKRRCEYQVYRILEKEKYSYILANLCIPDRKHHRKIEIDVLGIDETGLYVFDVLPHKGHIYGDEKEKKWRQTVKGARKDEFQNPLIRNRVHVNLLRHVVGEQIAEYCYGFVVFPKDCNIGRLKLSSGVQVVKQSELQKKIRHMSEGREKVLSQDERDKLYSILWGFTNV